MTNEDLTRLYNEANGIPEGKAPPITTERIFTAMRAVQERCAGVCDTFQKTSYLTIAKSLAAQIRGMKP